MRRLVLKVWTTKAIRTFKAVTLLVTYRVAQNKIK